MAVIAKELGDHAVHYIFKKSKMFFCGLIGCGNHLLGAEISELGAGLDPREWLLDGQQTLKL